ncbi:calmodulin-binding transcription activator 4-like isoform X2 [Cynara cardunculus var. scolymus]|uniref:calmodulin-binding transcription activator 4-like isoform X2 n=1 Tax=Cynara cardunculus var. scolymus TaxID=59895 RepID=UPI000D623162|nr:calmodulin-binding transcription activator 4-like isoform X2 [Cynara cardunculus var. scolymus]
MTTSGYHLRYLVEEAQVRWLKPGEVLFILQSFEEKQLTHEPPQKPPSGSLFLFDRKALRFFRRDGHSWRKKKDGKNLGEAHERLKVGNVEALNCYYAHGEQNPNFQRRSYWMLNSEMEHIVLVHYRDTTMGRKIVGPLSVSSPGSSTPVQSPISYASQLTRSAAASSEIGEPYESTSSPSCIEVTSSLLNKDEGSSHLNIMEGTEGISGSPNSEIDQALRRIEEQLSLDEDQLKDIGAFYSENEDSYDSGLTVDEQSYNAFSGMQGHSGRLHEYQQQSQDKFTSTSQQTSFWKDMLIYDGGAAGDGESQEDQVYPGDKNGIHLPQPRDYPVEKQENCYSGDNGAKNDHLKFSSYTHAKNMYGSDPDFRPATFDQEHIQMPLESDSSLTISQEQKFTIREISPGWGYATESTKVLIIGTFTCDPTKCDWTCMFGDIGVPVDIIQDGVICCQAPPCLPGKVTVCITSGNQEACSEISEFEYRDKPNSYGHANSIEKESHWSLEELLILVRLVQMLLSDQVTQKRESTRTDLLASSMAGEDTWGQVIEALLDGSLASSSATDWVLEELLKDKLQQWLSSRLQDNNAPPALSRREQGIIHMISGLGFWWALKPILNSGVSINFRDINGWTALHWAARFGREKMVAELLASGAFAGAVTDPSNQDPTGKTPASIAFACGHKGLAGYLSEMALTGHLSSLTLQQTELSLSSADIEAERTVNSLSNTNLVMNDDHLSLKDTLAAVRNATQAAARIQSAFRAHSFRRRQQKESAASGSEDEYGIFSSDIEGLSAASKLTFRNAHDHYAALSIQKKYRGWRGRKDFLALRQKVVKIQAHVRGHQVRKSYKVICWAVGMVEKIILRWRRKGTGLRGYRQESPSVDEGEDEDVVKAFRKQKVDVAVGEAVARVLSMVDSQPAQQQYRRMLENHRQAKAERGGDVTNMEKDDLY